MTARAAFVAVAAAVALACAPASSAATFVITGKGWGHGLGMSQYGAYGYAQHGWQDEAILEHYYSGATVTSGHPNDTVRVLLASGRSSVSIGSAASFDVAGTTVPAGTYTVTPVSAQVRVSNGGTTLTVGSPATISPGAASLSLGGTLYRGTLDVLANGSASLAVRNSLSRQAYLQGVVPREMPASWLPAALRAQATAARTYSLAVSGHCAWNGTPAFCATTSDQVYGGRSAETAATNTAVADTAGQAVTSGGSVVTAYFFSTSGGATATKAQEWGGAAVPYLVSVPDPYDAISAHHVWGPLDPETDCTGTTPDCVYTGAQVRALLGMSVTPTDLRVTARHPTGRVATLTASAGASSVTLDGTDARTKLGLRSTWFHVGALSITASRTTVPSRGRVTLSGLARRGATAGWGTAVLQRRPRGASTWTTVTTLPDGAWSSVRRPRATTDFRVLSGNAVTKPKRILVATG